MGLVRSIAARLHPSLNSPCHCEGWSREEVGDFGEKVASLHIQRNGGVVLYRGYRAAHGGEVDLVCRDKQTLCFVEVKTRRSLTFGSPVEAVTAAKQQLVIRGAMDWLSRLGEKREGIFYRFDVVEVLLIDGNPPEVSWMRNAFKD